MRSERQRGLIRLIGARVVVSTLLLGSGVVFQVSAPGSLPIDPFFFLIGLTYCLSVIYAVTLSHVERHPWLVDGQFACDAFTVTAVLHFTGGVTSYFPLLYALPIVGAGTLQRRGLRVAGLSSLLYAFIVINQYAGGAGYVSGQWVADIRAFLPPVRVALYTVAANATGFFIIAWLSGSLAERVRRADARAERASMALADLQAFNEHIVSSLTSGLATTDADGRLLTFNPAAERITRLSAAEAVGLNASELLQLPEPFVSALQMPFEPGRGRRVDYVFRTGDGTEIDIGLAATELATPEGHRGLLLTFQDVTEMRRLEHDSRRRQRLAAVGEMAAGIAHEIRNPLASMRGAIQVLRQELDLSDQQASLMDIVLRESDRLNGTIRSFLAYARPQQRAVEAVDVGKVLRDAATLIGHSTDVRPDHEIEVVAAGYDLLHETDESQLRQVIWNLATNGLRAMPEGGRLRLSARRDSAAPDAALVLEVCDTGMGMAPDQMDRLFEPFRGSFDRGTGLGLAIVHRIVNDFGGEIRIASTPGQGTTVSVKLPGRHEVPASKAPVFPLAASGTEARR
jgi:two-component system, NtrC family, sensor histidine kinase PilS